MLKPKTISRKLATALRTLRNDGLDELFALIKVNVEQGRERLALKARKRVVLDGCTFDIDQISSISMMRALVDGKYEDFERRAVREYVCSEYPIIELGGCIGVVACIANRVLKDRRSHVVVEASPSVIPFLQRNRDLNDCEFEILNRAIAYGRQSVSFVETTDYWGNTLRSAKGGAEVTVGTARLQDIIEERGYERFTLICDIEGHEYDLVCNEPGALRKADTIILETHARLIGEAKTQELLGRLTEMGFCPVDEDSFVVVLKRSSVSHEMQLADTAVQV